MQITILSLFPGMFAGPMQQSIVGRAISRKLLDMHVEDIRDHTRDRHRVVDDVPYGGGSGMVMKPEPVAAAIEWVRARRRLDRLFLLSPQGEPFRQATARRLAGLAGFGLLCGHYEGVDERVRSMVDGEISVGDFVLTGGEPAAWVIVDAVCRLIPGVLGNEQSSSEESFEQGLLEYPQYTRPRVFRGLTVPEVLLSGDHARIRRWRRQQSLIRTRARRPDLFCRLDLDAEDLKLLAEFSAAGTQGERR
ncbi:MAG: tRNA (guanosine(37)-N1)-methyltransferase TrmD [Deltaproteobacteria bacterium]|nr:tRNA (guanosine(37)-N1)-methyltransferase TrmD [Deltaproteobacteria bacterium]